MIGKKNLETEPISNIAVKHILEEVKENYELSYEQNISLDHTTKFSKISLEDSEKLIQELKDKKIRTKQAVRIVNIMPEDMSDLRLMFAKERFSITNEELGEILEIIDKYRIETPVDEIIEEEASEEIEEEISEDEDS